MYVKEILAAYVGRGADDRDGMYPDTLHARLEMHDWRGLTEVVNLIERPQYFY